MSTVEEPLAELERELETEPHLVFTLERHRGWLALEAQIVQRRAAKQKSLVHAILKGDDPVDQRRVDYLRGYFDALDWMTGLPRRMRLKLKEEGGESAKS